MLFALYGIAFMEVLTAYLLLMLKCVLSLHAQICIFTCCTVVNIHMSALWARPILLYTQCPIGYYYVLDCRPLNVFACNYRYIHWLLFLLITNNIVSIIHCYLWIAYGVVL